MASHGPRTDPTALGGTTVPVPTGERPVLRMLEPSALTGLLEPAPGELRIGRDPECEIHVPDPGCSRFHARLVVRSPERPSRRPRSVVEDLGSTNGTWVNETRIAAPHALRVHDKLRIGDTLFSYLLLDDREIDAMRQVAIAAMNDALTGLANRWTFEQDLARELARASRYRWPLSLLMVDLDHFKRVNDTFGHVGGDRVLHEVGKVLLDGKRSFDLAGRLGGEEMLLALPQTPGDEAVRVAERLRSTIAGLRVPSDDKHIRLTASIGVAVAEPGCIELAELFTVADAAMYRAKALGRNQVFWLPPPAR